ncbi:MAG: helix-turn-helix transcriptional regulator [Armatimonadetes bacterium]|nr:helix-turn-helix transcriptional regulator [Armatimonadota bacterium]
MSNAAEIAVLNRDPDVTPPEDLPTVDTWLAAGKRAVIVLATASSVGTALGALWTHRDKIAGWLLRDDTNSPSALLSVSAKQLLAKALYYRDPATRERVLYALSRGVGEHLIAEAEVVGDQLEVCLCSLEPPLRVPLSAIPHGSGQPIVERYGAYLEWPDADIQLGVDELLERLDPERLAKLQQAALLADQRYGAAIRFVRIGHSLRQTDIAAVSAREVGRIERGEHQPRLETLRKLAAAHGMPVNDYLEAVAEAIGQ